MDYNKLYKKQKVNMNIGWKKSDIISAKNKLGIFVDELSLNKGFKLINNSITGRTVLSICAGSGFEANYFYKKGAIVTATDISEEACKKINERNKNINVQVENSEKLSFKDNSFDYVIVRAGLHHLPRPMIGVYEMLRVAKKGILIIEAQDSIVMRLFRKIGLVIEVESSGNYVYTFTRREIQKVCKTLFLPIPKIETYFYQWIPLLNIKVYPKLNGKIWYLSYKYLLIIFNFFFGRFGNNFICFINKK